MGNTLNGVVNTLNGVVTVNTLNGAKMVKVWIR